MKDFSLARAVRFIGIGGVATLTYWLVLLTLSSPLRIEPIAASVIAHLVGVTVSFLGHRNITYRSRAFIGPELARFVTMQAICFVLGNLAFWLATVQLRLPVFVGGLALTLVSVGVSYVICEIWIFRSSSDRR